MTKLTELLAQLEGQEFESFIRDLWAARGWNTQLTPRSGDDGVDIILERDDFYYQKKLVQTKCIQPEDTLSRGKVQKYSYLLHQNYVDEALLITTGGFTDGAKESAETANLKLISGETLEKLVFDTIDTNRSEFDPEKFVPNYNFDTTKYQSNTEDTLISNSGSIDPTEISTELRSTVENLSDSSDIYSRLLATLSNEHLALDNRLTVLFQLFRGKDPLHVLLCTDAEYDYRPLLNRVTELQHPIPAEHVNCQRADVDTVVGTGLKKTIGQQGLISELNSGILSLSEFDQNRELSKHLVEPLETGNLRSTKRGTHDVLDLSFSALAVGTPKYGSWDGYEPMGKQIPFGPRVISSFDILIFETSSDGIGSLKLESITQYENSDPVETHVFRAYRVIANDLEPIPTDDTSTVLNVIESRLKTAIESETDMSDTIMSKPRVSQWIKILRRAAQASARIQLRESVLIEDVRRAGVVLPYSLNTDLYNIVQNVTDQISNSGPFDMEFGEGQTANIKQLISDIESEFKEGAPIEEVLKQAGKIDMDASKVEQEIEKLRHKGDVYEPRQGHLRVNMSFGSTSISDEGGENSGEIITTGTSKDQRDRIKNIKGLISNIEADFERGAPIKEVFQRVDEIGLSQSEAKKEIEKLRRKGDVYESRQNFLRTT